MKKYLSLALIAFSIVAISCNSGVSTEEPKIDSTKVETVIIDSTPVVVVPDTAKHVCTKECPKDCSSKCVKK